MFKNLVAFLEAFDVPTLCMTATLPRTRREQLERVGLEVYPRAEHRVALPDLVAEEEAPRYRVLRVAGEEDAWIEAKAAWNEGLRVLWVVNTVDRCQARAKQLANKLGVPVSAYHSRFTLSDRQRVHGDVVRAFQQRAHPAVAVTTQVCEMSLDLDADVLITELAPVTSLVQRFGRSNRKREGKGPDFRARVIVYEPERAKPYDNADFVAARGFLRAVGDGEVSQARLATLLEQHAREEAAHDGGAHFLDGGYYATTRSLRDIEEFNESCVLDTDLVALEPFIKKQKKDPWDGYIVPVPRGEVLGDDARPAWLPKWVGLARGSFYDKHYGYMKGGSIG
jgi:CRISPR-associated endonuclease/helicase Cas3